MQVKNKAKIQPENDNHDDEVGEDPYKADESVAHDEHELNQRLKYGLDGGGKDLISKRHLMKQTLECPKDLVDNRPNGQKS